jgi:hypothetical protein
MIKSKHDKESVENIISIGYPENKKHLDELLLCTADPNWPIAHDIYNYFVSLGKCEVTRVLNLAEEDTTDPWWKYNLITKIISAYDDETIRECVNSLKFFASRPGTEECDIEALRILVSRKLVGEEEISRIARRNLFTYNMYIKETLEIAEAAIYKFPLSEHTV